MVICVSGQETHLEVAANQVPDSEAVKEAAVPIHEGTSPVAGKDAASPHTHQDPVPLGIASEPLTDDELAAHQAAAGEKPASKKYIKRRTKLLRNSGKAYVTKSGKNIPPRQRQPPHECKFNKCIEKITPDIGDKIFNDFWEELANRDEQAKYVAARVTTKPIQRRRQRDPESTKNRTVTYEYSFDINGAIVKVCKDTFLKTLNVSETFVRFIMEKKAKSVSGLIPADGRGRHAPKHKLSEDTTLAIKRHIDSFPVYVSHYSQSQTNVLYFPPHLKIIIMHNLYREGPENPPISYSVYRKFVRSTGKKFKKNPW